MTVQSMQNIYVLGQLATDREAQLRCARAVKSGDRSSRHLRRWVGLQLVRFGAWVAAEPTMRRLTVRHDTP